MKLVIYMNYYKVKKNEWPCKSIIVTFSQRFMNIRLKCFYALNFNISKTLKLKEYIPIMKYFALIDGHVGFKFMLYVSM